MRVCFCVSSLFLLLVLFEEQRTPLKKKEKEKVLVSIQIFKNFQKFLTYKRLKERATEHSLLSRARSIQVRVQNVRTRALSFGLLLKVPSSNASKLSHKSEKMSVDCAKNSKVSLKEGFAWWSRGKRYYKQSLRHKKSEKKNHHGATHR